MRRTAKIKINLSTAQILIDKKKEKIAKLKKQIEILETLPLNDMEHVITAGGAIYGE